MKKLKKIDIDAEKIDYFLYEHAKVKNIQVTGSDSTNYRTDNYSISNHDSIPFYIILGETLKIKDKKYFTGKRYASCYVDFKDLDKLNLDESLIHDGKICIDLSNKSLLSSDYQIIPEEKLKELKKNKVYEYFES